MLDGDVFFCDNPRQELGQIGGNARLPDSFNTFLTLNHY